MSQVKIERADVVDWADAGPLFYGDMSEDGERPILRPDHEAVVQAITPAGEVYNYVGKDFKTDFARAESFAKNVQYVGTINTESGMWMFLRVIYGSDAYIEGGYEEAYAAQERADDGLPF